MTRPPWYEKGLRREERSYGLCLRSVGLRCLRHESSNAHHFDGRKLDDAGTLGERDALHRRPCRAKDVDHRRHPVAGLRLRHRAHRQGADRSIRVRVLGVDINPSMRAFAAVYVESDRFVACSAAMLDLMLERGLSFDNAISIWVLQHCERPAGEIDRIRRALKADGKLLVVNSFARVVPRGGEKALYGGTDARAQLVRRWCRCKRPVALDLFAIG
jgi:SAM-dependent methyltransferase